MSRFDSLEGWQGWQQKQGWLNQQGWSRNGLDGDPSSGLLVEGLLRNREALLSTGTGSSPAGPVGAPRPKPEVYEELRGCADDVRMKVLVYELLEPLVISPDPNGKDSKGLRVNVLVGDAKLASIARPRRAAFEQQVAYVEEWARRRGERAAEILSQMGPQMAYWSAALSLSGDRTPRTLELCETAMVFASFVVQKVKQMMGCPRPSTFKKTVQPMIPNPGHSTFPSGHATEAFMMARVLQELLALTTKEEKALLQAQANRIALNRVVAGVHFDIDTIAGRMLGECLAEYFLWRCSALKQFAPRSLGDVTGSERFEYEKPMDGMKSSLSYITVEKMGRAVLPPNGNLDKLWDAARAECVQPSASPSLATAGKSKPRAAAAKPRRAQREKPNGLDSHP